MKKYLYFLFVALFATMSITLTSCGKDNSDEPESTGDLVGTWEDVSELTVALGITQYIQFNANGDYTEVNIYGDEDDVEVLRGKWTRNGDKVIITSDDSEPTTATIVSLSNSELVLNIIFELQYKKVPDSKIEKYL